MNRYKLISAGAMLALLFLAGCGSSGGLGDIFGGGSNTTATNEIRGTVDSVDVSNRSILLTNVNTGSMLSSGGGSSTARVYYDDRTPVEYQGQTYRPENLERGDQISARVTQSGNQLHADSMTVLYNAGGSGGSGSSTYPSTSNLVRGTVRYIDPSRRTIEIERSGYSTMVVEYDTRTTVDYSGRSYRPEDIERGDEVEVRVRDLGTGRFLADQINVLRSVSGTTSGVTQSTIRGTVRYIDTSRRTIELEQTRWLSGFSSGGSGTTGTVVVQYDSNTRVEHQGNFYPATNLERGDIVEVQVDNPNSSTLHATRIYLVQDVNAR